MIVGQEKPSLDELAHHGVKGMHWGRHRETVRLTKQAANLQSTKEHYERLRDNKPKNTTEKIQRAGIIAGNLGSKKIANAALQVNIDELSAKHKEVVARLNTPESERHMKGSTKAKIALGGVVAARVLYVAGGLAINQLAVSNRAGAAESGVKAIASAASKLNYAKAAKGAYKITTMK